MKSLPSALIVLRVLLGPALLIVVKDPKLHAWIGPVLVAATLSDIFDGVVARRLGIATEALRVADGRADFWFYMWVCASVWARSADIVIQFRIPLAILICMDAISYCIDLIKFKRIATFHAYTAKIWGLTLFLASCALLVFHAGGGWMWLAITAGIISNLDGLAIKLILPTWQHDVPSCWHAWKSVKAV